MDLCAGFIQGHFTYAITSVAPWRMWATSTQPHRRRIVCIFHYNNVTWRDGITLWQIDCLFINLWLSNTKKNIKAPHYWQFVRRWISVTGGSQNARNLENVSMSSRWKMYCLLIFVAIWYSIFTSLVIIIRRFCLLFLLYKIRHCLHIYPYSLICVFILFLYVLNRTGRKFVTDNKIHVDKQAHSVGQQ